MNNICIYAEVIALARFFLGLLLSPQTLNIQLPSPDLAGVVVVGGAVIMLAALTASREGEAAEQEGDPDVVCVWGAGGGKVCHGGEGADFPLQLVPPRGASGKGILGLRGRSWVLNP